MAKKIFLLQQHKYTQELNSIRVNIVVLFT